MPSISITLSESTLSRIQKIMNDRGKGVSAVCEELINRAADDVGSEHALEGFMEGADNAPPIPPVVVGNPQRVRPTTANAEILAVVLELRVDLIAMRDAMAMDRGNVSRRLERIEDAVITMNES